MMLARLMEEDRFGSCLKCTRQVEGEHNKGNIGTVAPASASIPREFPLWTVP